MESIARFLKWLRLLVCAWAVACGTEEGTNQGLVTSSAGMSGVAMAMGGTVSQHGMSDSTLDAGLPPSVDKSTDAGSVETRRPLNIAEPPEKPNVVVFIADDHGLLDSQPYAETPIRTPTIQEMANQGVTFDRAYVGSPSCGPSRAILLTGLMSARNGAEPNHAPPHDHLKKLPQFLQEVGYTVAAFGKVQHPGAGISFDQTGNFGEAVAYLDDWDEATPLLLFAGEHRPHTPWPSTSSYQSDDVTLPVKAIDTPVTREIRTKYYQDVTDMDENLRRVWAAASRKFGDDFLFIYTSDHGAQWPFGKWNLYETGLRVPFIAVWPGVLQTGVRTDAMISWVDLLPTLLELGGGTPPPGLDGRSFFQLFTGEAVTHRDVVFGTHTGANFGNVYPIRSIRRDNFKLIHNLHPEFLFRCIIDDAAIPETSYFTSWTEAAETDPAAEAVYQAYRARPEFELFDLADDPDELNNLANDPAYAAERQALHEELEAWMDAQGDQRLVHDTPTLL